MRCLLASCEKVPAARRVKGEGTEGSNNYRRGRLRWAEQRLKRPVPVARAPDTLHKILHPSVSPLRSFSPSCFYLGVTAARLFRFCLPREPFEPPPTRSLGGKGEARPTTSKVQAKASSLFRVRHFASILLPAAASAPSWPNSPSRQPSNRRTGGRVSVTLSCTRPSNRRLRRSRGL